MSRTVRTMCPMNCHPTLCGMLAEVDGDKLLGVSGDRENPDSRGFLCVRGQASKEIIGNPKRLLRPLIRSGDAFVEAGWDEALDLISERMKQAGRESVGLWSGHGAFSNNYGTRINSHLLRRFANLWGCQWWHPTMICWGLGAIGAGITGALETNTKEDMGDHSRLIVLWGANLASQPNTAPHLKRAKARGAYVVTIDVRRTEAAAQSDEVLLIKPGTDAALALAMMHVIVSEGLYDRDFVARHTVGFDALKTHLHGHSPSWAAPITGISGETIAALARRYASTHPAMIVLGGSSMHKGSNGWQGARAVTCLPALTGDLGVAGGGLGPRHGSRSHGQGLVDITVPERRPSGTYIPSQMPRVTEAMLDGRLKVMFLFGTDMLSSYAEAGAVARGLEKAFVVSHELFMNDTARRFADVVLPSTCWLEELGAKSTNTHLYLMERALEPAGETKPVTFVLKQLALRLGIRDFYPWQDDEALIDALIDHPSTGHATVAALRAEGGMRALRISHVAHPDRRFPTPSGKIEFVSAQAADLGLAALPVYAPLPSAPPQFPLQFRQGRTLTQFHAFYDQGRALPTLARLDAVPQLWLSPADAESRRICDGASIRIYNARGEMRCRALVTDRMPAGTVWMRDGWAGVNELTSGAGVLPDEAVEVFGFSGGQAAFDAAVEVALA